MDYLTVFLQATGSFFVILFLARISGKQQIAQLTFLDYIVAITVGSIASSLTIVGINKFGPIMAGLITWFLWTLIIGLLSMKSRLLSKLFHGTPTVIIQNGKIMESNIAKLPNYQIEDLRAQLRAQGIFHMADVEFAILETSGQLSILKKSQQQPVTKKDLNLQTDYQGLSHKIIFEGKIIKKNLEGAKLNEKWLQQELKKQGIRDIKEVMYAALDTQGNLFVDKYRDRRKNIKDF